MKDERARVMQIAECLLQDVYYPVSVCLYINREGSICSIHQFDSLYCPWKKRKGVQAARIWLVSNHHDGSMYPFAEDERNFARLKAEYPHAACFFAIYAEDAGFMECAR